MTARSRMTQRALVQRHTSPGTDDYGNPLPGTWATHLTAMACFLYGTTEREAVADERTAVVTSLKMMAPVSADVTEQDRISGVTDRRGRVIESGLLHVEVVLRKQTHNELTLTRASA